MLESGKVSLGFLPFLINKELILPYSANYSSISFLNSASLASSSKNFKFLMIKHLSSFTLALEVVYFLLILTYKSLLANWFFKVPLAWSSINLETSSSSLKQAKAKGFLCF